MNEETIVLEIPGAKDIAALFGCWPSFHDAEIISIELNRASESRMKIHTFAMLNRTDSRGHYVTEKHTIVTFLFADVSDTELLGFNQQNVVSALAIEKVAEGYKVLLGGCYGVEGFIISSRLRLEMEPGIPPRSVYVAEGENAGVAV